MEKEATPYEAPRASLRQPEARPKLSTSPSASTSGKWLAMLVISLALCVGLVTALAVVGPPPGF